MFNSILYIILKIVVLVLLLGLTLFLPVGIPALFITSVAALFYYLVFDSSGFHWAWIIVMFALAIVAEVLEQITGSIGAKKYGGSKLAMLAAMIGAILGGLLGTTIIPIIGTLIGVFLGCFSLTFLTEYLIIKKDSKESVKVAKGALIGRVLSVVIKYTLGFVLLTIFAILIFS